MTMLIKTTSNRKVNWSWKLRNEKKIKIDNKYRQFNLNMVNRMYKQNRFQRYFILIKWTVPIILLSWTQCLFMVYMCVRFCRIELKLYIYGKFLRKLLILFVHGRIQTFLGAHINTKIKDFFPLLDIMK